jgi:hypothetical protein
MSTSEVGAPGKAIKSECTSADYKVATEGEENGDDNVALFAKKDGSVTFKGAWLREKRTRNTIDIAHDNQRKLTVFISGNDAE